MRMNSKMNIFLQVPTCVFEQNVLLIEMCVRAHSAPMKNLI